MGTLNITGARVAIAITPGKGNIAPPTTGWCKSSAGVPTDLEIAEGVGVPNQIFFLYEPPPLDDGLVDVTLTLGYDETTPTFLLDGINFVSFNDLPAGFIITSLNVSIEMQLSSAVGGGVSSNPGSLTFGVDPVLANTTFPGIFDYPNPALDHSWSEDLIPTGFSITANEFLTWKPFIGGGINTNRGVSPSSVNINGGMVFNGTYEIQQFKFNFDTESPIDVGQDILLSTDDKTLDMRKITHVLVDYTTLDNVDHEVDITDFDTTQFTLIFTMIDFGNAPKVTIKLQGTQFSGSVTLGDLLTIRFTDGTGIYKLDLTATHDTLYIQDYDPVQTIDVKIPNPLAKTAFVP